MYLHTRPGRKGVITSVVVVLAMLIPCAAAAAQGETGSPDTTLAKPGKPVAEFVHPEALVSPQWLATHLADPSVRIVDARWPSYPAFYEAGHIPGAVSFDVFSIVPIPSPGDFSCSWVNWESEMAGPSSFTTPMAGYGECGCGGRCAITAMTR